MTHAYSIDAAQLAQTNISSDVLIGIGFLTFAISSIYFVPRMARWFVDFFNYAQISRRNESRFLAAAEASMDALFLLDAVRDSSGEIEDFRFTFLNQKAQHLLNLPTESILGAQLCELMPMHRTEGFLNQFKQVVLTGVPSITEFSVKDEQINASWLRYSSSS